MAASGVVLYHNGRFHTMSAPDDCAAAMVVDGDRIAFVGSEEEALRSFAVEQRVDLDGQHVFPGLIDAHAHLMGQGFFLLNANLLGATSPADVVTILQAHVKERALTDDDDVVLGFGWDQNLFAGGAFPSAADLDAAFPRQRVWLKRVDAHAAWANSAAMRGLALPAVDPPGGQIVRLADGTASGVFIDAAMKYVDERMPAPSAEQLSRAYDLAVADCLRHGLTMIHDAGESTHTIFELFKRKIDDGAAGIRLYAMLGGTCGAHSYDDTLREVVARHADGTLPLPPPGYKNMLVVRAVKLFVDGALGSRGAALIDDYSDDAGNRGLLQIDDDSMRELVRRWFALGYQVCTHAIGDRANRLVLDAYQSVPELRPAHRWRVEHAQIVAGESEVRRFADMGVVASMQPTHATSDMAYAEARLGPERTAAGAYVWRSFLDHGVVLALGSDFPIEPVDPLLGIYAAVSRQSAAGSPPDGWHPRQRLTRWQAVSGFTTAAAYASFMEGLVGELRQGAFADFVVLSANLLDEHAPPQQILATRVLRTYVGGRLLFHQ